VVQIISCKKRASQAVSPADCMSESAHPAPRMCHSVLGLH
jgi:hypothetical protein